MRPLTSFHRPCASLALPWLFLLPSLLTAQHDSATVAAGAQYAAGGVRRFLLGATYRDLWTTPVRVPIVDLGTFAGGLRPTEAGLNAAKPPFQSKRVPVCLRFVDKDNVPLREALQGTIVGPSARPGQCHPSRRPVAVAVARGRPSACDAAPGVLPDDARGEFRANRPTQHARVRPPPLPGLASQAPRHPGRGLPRPMLDRNSRSQWAPSSSSPRHGHAGQPGIAIPAKWALISTQRRMVPIPRDQDKAFISFVASWPLRAGVRSW
jgi:hypothetical protein